MKGNTPHGIGVDGAFDYGGCCGKGCSVVSALRYEPSLILGSWVTKTMLGASSSLTPP